MNAVEIDISKGKRVAEVFRPLGEVYSPTSDVCRTAAEPDMPVSYIQKIDGETYIITEHTGKWY